MRKTKIIATLGPATESPEMLRSLIETGVNCFRLNMSHAPHDWVRAIVPRRSPGPTADSGPAACGPRTAVLSAVAPADGCAR